MKKIIISLLSIILLTVSTIVYAEENVVNMNISISKNNDNYVVSIPTSANGLLASETPTMKVNTDYLVATVKNPSGNIIESSINNGVVSFEVNAGGNYTIEDKISINKNASCDSNAKIAIENILADASGITAYDQSGSPILLDGTITFSSNINGTTVSGSDEIKFIEAISNAIDDDDVKGVYYFDISCQLNGSSLKDFGGDGDELIPLSFDLPISLKSNQMLKLFRIHDNVVKEIPIDSFINGKITFRSSHFSVFAFVIADKPTNNGSNAGNKTSGYTVPKTCVN